jgi:hypothetical protein
LVGAELHEAGLDAVRRTDEARQAAVVELRVAVDDLLARQDEILSGYDRRVAALTNRVLDLEERLAASTVGQGRSRGGDADTVLFEHDKHTVTSQSDRPAPPADHGEHA